MDVFEEHQLFVPIINDPRFTPGFEATLSKRTRFNKVAYDAIFIMRRENNLSVSLINIEHVQQALWEYYSRQLTEAVAFQQHERDAAVYDTKGFEQHTNHVNRQPKESPSMATPTFVTITYVSGKALNELTNEDLINAIKACEKEIDSLNEVKRPSTKIKTRIDELNTTADKIRDALDSRP